MPSPNRCLATFIFISTVVVCAAGWTYYRANQRSIVPQNAWYVPPPEWLEKKLGEANAVRWQGHSEPHGGDEVWSFRSPPETWNQEMGTGGICLVRGGKIVDGYVTIEN